MWKHLIVGLLSVLVISFFQPATNIPKSPEVQAAPIEAAQPAVEPEPVIVPTPAPEPAPAPPNEFKQYIYQHESGNCATKWEGEYGACPEFHGTPTSPNVGYGLCQATPAWKMATAGADWATNPETQDKWCTQYAADRYGGWQQAYQSWLNQKWW